MKNEKYFLGLDIGTDSVGYAVTNEEYSLIKYHGEDMWGSTVFESAKQCAERRGFRNARRRLDRRQHRVELIRELFAKEIGKLDPEFFIRLKESALFAEDRSTSNEYDFLNDKIFDGKTFNEKYPTIHHLIFELMNDKSKHDVRLVYIACAWLVAHRGHFFSEVDKNNIKNILDFEPIYQRFEAHFSDEKELPWSCDANELANVLKLKIKITDKEKKLGELLFKGRVPKNEITDENPYSIKLLIKLLAGGSTKLKEIFGKEEYDELGSISMAMADDAFQNILAEIGDDAEILIILKSMTDWAVLTDILSGTSCISEAKIKIYEQHKADLANLKKFIKKYYPDRFNEIFKDVEEKLNNYPAYSKHFDPKSENSQRKSANREEFNEYLLKIVKDTKCDKRDKDFYEDMIARLSINRFLPKQVDGDNRVIPYQLYWHELDEILKLASSYLPFLNEKDEDNISIAEKILSVFEFRIPYFVGPLVDSKKSKFAWMKRKADGKIYPWNFEKMIDLDQSEQEFIDRMTNTCTYLPGEDVLAKYSLIYSKYEVLNEINNIKVNSQPISVEDKQLIFEELFKNHARVTMKRLREFMLANGICEKDSMITGIDVEGGIKSSLRGYMDFRNLLNTNKITEDEVENYIVHSTYSEDRVRLKSWILKNYPNLDEKNQKYMFSLKYKNFGRLSKRLLVGINGVSKETGEIGTIIDFLWNTNDNLMQLLSDRYTFIDEINKIKNEYYSEYGNSLDDILDSMYISNAVKRPIMRTLSVVNDIKSVMKKAPEKIFIEMARGANEDQKNKRTKSRKEQILELYKNIKDYDVSELRSQLEDLGSSADNKLQSETLFLYFIQLGKCMYSGETITLDSNLLKFPEHNIDHIYPQCYVKDDSILNNKVLVLSNFNKDKGDKYPVPSNWRHAMLPYWKMLNKNGLITDEKFKRLIRATPFTNDERKGFINRQLVETRQSTKAIAQILQTKFPDSEIVYVKAGLVSEFRHKYDMLKCRSINDLHHAKDAYLNIVVGNVYNERFSKKWFNIDERYSLNYQAIFEHPFERNLKIWNGKESLEKVIKIMRKQSAKYTRFAFCRKGGFFAQMPVKAANNLVPIKEGLSTEKYGGYNKTTATAFTLVKFTSKKAKKTDIMIMPIELMYYKQYVEDDEFATQYAIRTISEIIEKPVDEVSFMLNKRILKINTVFSVDGFRMCLGSKKSNGIGVGMIPATSLKLDYDIEKYIKRLERFVEKKKINKNIVCNSEYDEITIEDNLKLYDIFIKKAEEKPFALMRGNQVETLKTNKDKFKKLDIENQIIVLMNVLLMFKTGRTGTVDLSMIGSSKNSCESRSRSTLSSWAKYYSDVRIIDVSSSGLREKQSINLLELL